MQIDKSWQLTSPPFRAIVALSAVSPIEHNDLRSRGHSRAVVLFWGERAMRDAISHTGIR
jgi:hypothetical protein